MTEPKPGQLWRDMDKRNEDERFLRVTEIKDGRAVCESWWDVPGSLCRTVRIRVDRLRPPAYELVEEAKS